MRNAARMWEIHIANGQLNVAALLNDHFNYYNNTTRIIPIIIIIVIVIVTVIKCYQSFEW